MYEKVIVFGCGMKLEELWERNILAELDIIAYTDNNKDIYGQMIHGKRVISPTEISLYDYDAIYISTEQHYDTIKKQLVESCSVPEKKIRHFNVEKNKYEGEIAYWKVWTKKNGFISEEHYRNMMLAIAEEADDLFWKEKIVVDFGCGPLGSLTWTKTPAMKIGVDVLATRYLEEFGEEIVKQDMIYVTSSEEYIPMPNESADYLIVINSLDHVDNFDRMTEELLRILKGNGVLLASFNINELCTECEPQTLTEQKLQNKLLKYFSIESYKLQKTGKFNKDGEEKALLYIKAVKKVN